jgi:tRNA pseudouridine55 synthase
VNKPEGPSSQAVVNRIKRIFGTSKAGHTGTLDPLASGVLPILVGRAVKASEFLLTEDKHYGATLLLGERRDTEDITGELISSSSDIPSEDAVRSAIRGFVGEIMQTPPMYSALKVGGKKLCDLARQGVTVEREARPVTVYSIGVTKLSLREYFLDVRCSKGTYIRTLCADIGKALGCGGIMATLERLDAGGFSIENSFSIPDIEAMNETERLSALIPTEALFEALPKICLPEFFEKLCRGGCEIYLKKIGTHHPVGTRVRIFSQKGAFFALGEVKEYEEGLAIKAIKTFAL